MKSSAIRTPISSDKSSTTTADTSTLSETRDSFYFPGCRKDANCNCEMCIESMNATMDLKIHGSSTTNFSTTSRRKVPPSPISFLSPADLLTPEQTNAKIKRMNPSPRSISTRIAKRDVNSSKKEERFDFRVSNWVRFLLGLILISGLEYGFPSLIPRVLRAQLSPNSVSNLIEKLSNVNGLNAKFSFLESDLEASVRKGNRVSRCSSDESLWEINQENLLLSSKCVLFKSMAEEVSIWGWPLQTSGILASRFSSRSLGIISGSVAQWINSEANYLIRKGNDSWTNKKWSSSVVQLDLNTWILEYRRSFLLDNVHLVSSVVEFLKMRVTTEVKRFLQGFWLPEFGYDTGFISSGTIATPT